MARVGWEVHARAGAAHTTSAPHSDTHTPQRLCAQMETPVARAGPRWSSLALGSGTRRRPRGRLTAHNGTHAALHPAPAAVHSPLQQPFSLSLSLQVCVRPLTCSVVPAILSSSTLKTLEVKGLGALLATALIARARAGCAGRAARPMAVRSMVQAVCCDVDFKIARPRGFEKPFGEGGGLFQKWAKKRTHKQRRVSFYAHLRKNARFSF